MANTNGLGADRMKTSGSPAASDHIQDAGRFASSDVEMLRSDLLQSGLDSWQVAEMIGTFLSGRGYGVPSDAVHHSVESIEESGFTMESLNAELEKLAIVM